MVLHNIILKKPDKSSLIALSVNFCLLGFQCKSSKIISSAKLLEKRDIYWRNPFNNFGKRVRISRELINARSEMKQYKKASPINEKVAKRTMMEKNSACKFGEKWRSISRKNQNWRKYSAISTQHIFNIEHSNKSFGKNAFSKRMLFNETLMEIRWIIWEKQESEYRERSLLIELFVIFGSSVTGSKWKRVRNNQNITFYEQTATDWHYGEEMKLLDWEKYVLEYR